MEFINNEKLRHTTFHKRKLSLKKKLHEFKTLCDVDACMIVYGPQNDANNMGGTGTSLGVELDVFPANPSEVRDIVEKYITRTREGPPELTASRNLNLSDYYESRARKVEDEISKAKRVAYKAKYPVWGDRFNDASTDQLKEILRLVERKYDDVQVLSQFIAEENQRASMMTINNGMFGHNSNMPSSSSTVPETARPVDDQNVYQRHQVMINNTPQQQYEGNYYNPRQFDDYLYAFNQFPFDGLTCADIQGLLPSYMPPAASYSCDPMSSGLLEHMAHNNDQYSSGLLEAAMLPH